MLELAKNDCARLLWLAEMVSEEAGIIQIWFSHVPWTEDRAHADKENMVKNIQEYFLMGFQTVFIEWLCLNTCHKLASDLNQH